MVRRSSQLVLVLLAALTAAQPPAPRFSAESNLAAHYATRDSVSAFHDVSGFAVEGGGQRSLMLAVAVQRGMEVLKKADLDESRGEYGVGGLDGETRIPRRAADVAAGISGGSWGVAALTYSATLSTRLGPYVEPESLTAEWLKAVDPAETMTRFAEPSLFDWTTPIQLGEWNTLDEIVETVTKRECEELQGWWNYFAYHKCLSWVEKAKGKFNLVKALMKKHMPNLNPDNSLPGGGGAANVLAGGLLPDNVLNAKGWWEYFSAYYMYSFDVDPRTELRWCIKEEAEKQYEHSKKSKTSVAGDQNFPNKPVCQRPGAPYPIVVAANRSSLEGGDVFPHVEYTPHNVHVRRTLSPGAQSTWGSDVLPKSYKFECPKDVTSSMRKLIGHEDSSGNFSNSRFHDLCESSPKTSGGLLVSALARSSYVPGMLITRPGSPLRTLCRDPEAEQSSGWGSFLFNRMKDYLGRATGVCKILAPYEDSFFETSTLQGKEERKIDVKLVDGGSNDGSTVPALIRNGATRVISVESQTVNEDGYRTLANLSSDDFAKSDVWKIVDCAPHACDPFRWFGLDPSQPEKKIFHENDLHQFLKNFFRHVDGRERKWEETGIVATHSLTTVENLFMGIPGGKKVVLTIAFIRNRKAWEDAAQKALGQKEFNIGETCVGDSGPRYWGIYNKTSVECMRLVANEITWHVVKNADDFDYSLAWTEAQTQ